LHKDAAAVNGQTGGRYAAKRQWHRGAVPAARHQSECTDTNGQEAKLFVNCFHDKTPSLITMVKGNLNAADDEKLSMGCGFRGFPL
jgi:hypothetical protein